MTDRSHRWYEEERATLSPGRSDARVLEEWVGLLAAMRARFEEDVPPPEVLVLYALQVSGREAALSAEERRRLDEQREAIEAALARYEGLRAVVDDISASCKDFEASWEAPLEDPAPAPDRAPAPPARARARLGWQIGAAVVAALLIAALFLLLRGDAGVVVTETAPGEIVQIELVDGSTVRLMEESRLVHPAEEALDRRVELVGRAYFDVQPGEERFEVSTPTARITVTGTSFGVQADAEITDVAIVTGSVVLAAPAVDEEVTLEAGERSLVRRGQAPTPVESVDVADHLAWTGLLLFRQTTLREIVARLERVYDVEITLASDLEGETITGTFDRTQPIEEILRAVAATLGVEVERVNNTFHLAPVSP